MFNRIASLLRETLVFWSSWFVKKDDNIWVFGSIRGLKYSDNAKYLFEYVNENTTIRAIWISKNKLVVDEIKTNGYEAYLESSTDALHYAKRAKVAVITHRGNRHKADLPFYAFNQHTKIIQLWHGFPLKMVGYDDKLFSFKHDEESIKWRIKHFMKSTFFPFLNNVNSASLTLALSQEAQVIFSKAFRIPIESVFVAGYPRNDKLTNTQSATAGKKIEKVIYMPTFRGSVDSDFDLFFQYGFDLVKLETFLRAEGMTLHIKLHPFNRPTGDLLQQLRCASSVSLLEHDDISEVLGGFDLLITDYSSVYIDYLLLDRPLIFAPFDREEYLKNDRNFYFDYEDITPGPKTKNWDEVMEQLQICNHDSQYFSQERESVKNRFHFYQDSKSSQRVYEAIANLIS